MSIPKITHHVARSNSCYSASNVEPVAVSLPALPITPDIRRAETAPTGRTIRGQISHRPVSGAALASMVKAAIREVAAQ